MYSMTLTPERVALVRQVCTDELFRYRQRMWYTQPLPEDAQRGDQLRYLLPRLSPEYRVLYLLPPVGDTLIHVLKGFHRKRVTDAQCMHVPADRDLACDEAELVADILRELEED